MSIPVQVALLSVPMQSKRVDMYGFLKYKLLVRGLPADDVESSDKAFSHLWEQQRGKIRALEDKYRWKLNENGVRHP